MFDVLNTEWTFVDVATYHTVSERNHTLQATFKPSQEPADPPTRSSRGILEVWIPQTEEEKAAILSQLELLLAHPLFFQSKRYPALLRFAVEQSLLGNADQVKERSIGIEVFGRTPGYDANADPVVRVTAGEIRKRLAQYYYDPANADQIRIELPTGSYVPVFQRVVEPPAQVDLALPIQSEGPRSDTGPSDALANSPKPRTLPLVAIMAGLFLILGGCALAGVYWFRHQPAATPPNANLDDFWQPMTAGPATVTVCLGEPARDSSKDGDPAQTIQHTNSTEPLYFHLHQSGLFALADVITLTRISEPLLKQHKTFRVSAASEASFAQLREGPVVLIGAFDNLWTMRLTRDLRFGFDSVEGTALIVDRKDKSKPSLATAWDLPYEKLARDYAIIARYRDSMTGQPVVIAAGISEEGTEAAGELLSNSAELSLLLQHAPENWRKMNMEAVIETKVIDGHSGPPQVRAVEFW